MSAGNFNTGKASELSVYVDEIDGEPVLTFENNLEGQIIGAFEGTPEELRTMLASALREVGRAFPMDRDAPTDLALE